MLLSEESQAIDVLPYIQHALWVPGQGITSLEHNQSTGILFLKATEHPSYGIRLAENCKTTRPSSGLSMLLWVEQQAMYVLPPIPHILWVYRQGLTSLGHNQYTRILIIQASKHPSCGTRFVETCKTTRPSSGLSMLLWGEPHTRDVLQNIPQVLWVHWARYNKPETQSIHWDPVL